MGSCVFFSLNFVGTLVGVSKNWQYFRLF